MSDLAWHFTGDTLRDGSPVPPDGEWLKWDGPCVMCESGLHASRRIIDALHYAPGSTICRVAVHGIANEHDDKLVCAERMILWRLENADDVLRAIARKAALLVIHQWDAPEVVRQYLETGDEALRDAAWSAASAAWSAWSAESAAWSAESAASAAWSAESAESAAWSAESAAWSAAAWSATDSAAAAAMARDKLNTQLEALVREAAGRGTNDA